MKTAMKMVLGSLAACLAAGALADGATITDVVVRQRWPWSRLVDINYVLTCEETDRVTIAVSAYNGQTPLNLALNALSGDLFDVSDGAGHIVWDPLKSAYTNQLITQFRVDLAPTPAPLYMIVNLTNAPGQNIEFVYEADLTNGLWGAWVRNPVTNRGTVVESVVWTDVTNNVIYKKDKLVLRRVPAGTFGMGETASLSTKLSKGFYAGVFDVTAAQWQRITAGTSSTDYKPKNAVSYVDIRGNTNDTPSVNWPTTGSTVSPTSFLGKLRAATGLETFDLPTEAQYEYACRAGTTTVFNDGNADVDISSATGSGERNNANTNDYMNALGWYQFNTSALQPVGQKAPNAWGLYDTQGNAWNWCLDWNSTLAGGTDPAGLPSGTQRNARGGVYSGNASFCRVANRMALPSPSGQYGSVGFRLVWNLP